MTPLAARVPAMSAGCWCKDFQRVKAGDVLVEIVDDDYRAQLDQAAGQRRQPRPRSTTSNSRSAAEGIDRAGRGDDRGERSRCHPLSSRDRAPAGICSRRASPARARLVEQAVDNEKRAAATLALNRAQLDQQRQQLNVLDSQEKQAQRDARRAAGGARSGADQSGLHAHHRAGRRHGRPAPGAPGQYLNVGTQVISLVPLPQCLGHRELQGNADDPHPHRPDRRASRRCVSRLVLHGHVDSWSPASGAQFCAAAARQRDRQLHQGRAADSGEDRARSRSGAGTTCCGPACR